jgi:hypothetical protein
MTFTPNPPPVMTVTISPNIVVYQRTTTVIDSNGSQVSRFENSLVISASDPDTGNIVCSFQLTPRINIRKRKFITRGDMSISVPSTSPAFEVFGYFKNGNVAAPAIFFTLLDQQGRPLPGVRIREFDYHIGSVLLFEQVQRGRTDVFRPFKLSIDTQVAVPIDWNTVASVEVRFREIENKFGANLTKGVW